jgi:hypothetical protein
MFVPFCHLESRDRIRVLLNLVFWLCAARDERHCRRRALGIGPCGQNAVLHQKNRDVIADVQSPRQIGAEHSVAEFERVSRFDKKIISHV